MDLQVIHPASALWLETLQQLQHDVYHLPGYACLEAKRTNTVPEAVLMVENDRTIFIPYLLRRCDNLLPEQWIIPEVFDVVSPYGYPGILMSDAATTDPQFVRRAMNELKRMFWEKGICSAFLRLHPLLNHHFYQAVELEECSFSGETVSVDLTLSANEIREHTKRSHRNRINRCQRLGLSARMVPCREYLKEFTAIYLETMNRVEAARGYLEFDERYFSDLHNAIGDKLHLCIVESEKDIAAAGLYTECNGIVQAIFGGTKTAFLKQSPTVLETDFVRFWAKDRGNYCLHLGGGVGAAKDSLFEFKANFSRQRHPFMTMRLITNEEKYRLLVGLRAKALNTQPELLLQSSFFPAYRSAVGG